MSVGRLGVITDVKLRIFPEKLIKRSLERDVSYDNFVSRVRSAQAKFQAIGVLPSWLRNAQAHWIPTDSTVRSMTIPQEPPSDAPCALVSSLLLRIGAGKGIQLVAGRHREPFRYPGCKFDQCSLSPTPFRRRIQSG